MIITKEFIWKTDHYGYHITNIDAMKNICVEGLKPLCGERSKLADDNFNGIFFFDNLYNLNEWIDVLYKNKNIYELELLRFNIKQRKWIIKNPDEFYLIHKVNKEKIEYLRFYDEENDIYLPLNIENYSSDNDVKVTWNSLDNYKILKKV